MNKTSYLAICLMMVSTAGMAHAAGDPKAGEAKAELCFDCHGVGGHSEDSTFPKLAGQFPDYIIKQIKDFKSGVRKDDTMTDMAMMIETDQDLEDIAAYFSSQSDMVGTVSDPPLMIERTVKKRGESAKVVQIPMIEHGKSVFLDSALTKCYECHGIDARGGGHGRMMGAPKLAGQHKDYLLKAMDDMYTRKRQADMFDLMWRGLDVLDEEERGAVAEFLSSLKPGEEGSE